MFFVKAAQITVDFFTSNSAVFAHARPAKAAQFIPNWWRQLPKPDYAPLGLMPSTSIKTCAGFTDLYGSGFIQPLWSDLNISISPTGAYEYKFADCTSDIAQHEAHQFEGSPFSDGFVHFKIHSPWVIASNSKTKWLFIPPVWNGLSIDDMYVAPGIVQSGFTNVPLNINVFFRKRQTPVVHRLPFGLPITHIIPLSEKRVVPKYHLVSDEELNKRKYETAVSRFFVNKFRRAKKLCPHAK